MGRSAPIRYSVYGVGLLVVAVVAGLIWWGVHPVNEPEPTHDARQSSTTTQPAGKYQFAKAHGTVRGANCEEHSYGRIEEFFGDTPCKQLSRTIYWTRAENVRVFSSVSVVTMPDASKAASLEHLTDSNGTGNVKDLLADGISVSGAPDTVKGGGYASGRDGNVVTIVESKPEAGKKLPTSVVTGVSRDALRLAGQ